MHHANGLSILAQLSRSKLLLSSYQTTVLGAASAVTGLLEAAVRLIKRMHKAYLRQQSLADVLNRHMLEIESVSALARIILDEDSLQTAAVGAELAKLQAVAVRLVNCVKDMDPGDKSVARQLAHQFVRGTSDEGTLTEIMQSLGHAKASLSLRVQLANVGLTRMVRDTVLGSVDVINRIDCLLVDLLGPTQGLKLARLVANRVSDGSFNWAAPTCRLSCALLDQANT